MAAYDQIIPRTRRIVRHAHSATYRETRKRRKRRVPAHGQQALHISARCCVRLQYKRIVHVHNRVVPELACGGEGAVRACPTKVTNAKLQRITNAVICAVGVAGTRGADSGDEQSDDDVTMHRKTRGPGPQGGLVNLALFLNTQQKTPCGYGYRGMGKPQVISRCEVQVGPVPHLLRRPS
jgi:hypothetical protein